MSLIIRRFKKELSKIEEGLSFLNTENVNDEDETKLRLLIKLSAMDELNDYIESYVWVKSNKSANKIKDIIKTDFDYGSVALKYGISINSLQVTLSRADRRLKAKIEEPLNLIVEGKVEEGLRVFRLGDSSKNAPIIDETLFLKDFLIKTEEPNDSELFSLAECVDALKVLRYYTHKVTKTNISKGGESKIAFLRYILESKDSKYIYQKQLILSFFNGDKSLQDIVKEEQETLELLNNVKR